MGTAIKETSLVSMTGSQFDPRNVHVDVDTTVMWTSEDSTDRTVMGASDNWSEDTTVSGKETTHIFEESGVCDVYCRFHRSFDPLVMIMKVGVKNTTDKSPLGAGGDDGGDPTSEDGLRSGDPLSRAVAWPVPLIVPRRTPTRPEEGLPASGIPST